MPTVTVESNVTLQQAAPALHGKLGSRYQVTTHGSGAQQALKVKPELAQISAHRLDQQRGGNRARLHL